MPKPPDAPAVRRWVGRLALPLTLLLPLIGAALNLIAAPGTAEPVAALFPPSYSRSETLAAVTATGARLIAPGGLPSIFVVQSDDPRFFDELHRAGAWLVLSSQAAAWCQ